MPNHTAYPKTFLDGTGYTAINPAVGTQQFPSLPSGALTKWVNALESQDAVALWVNLGSSTANGGNIPYGYTWHHRLAALLSRNAVIRLEDATAVPSNGFQFYNGAQGGATSANYLTEQRLDRIRFLQPILVTHTIGSNDFSSRVAPAVYKKNMRSRLKEEVFDASPDSVQLLFHQQGRQDVTAAAHPWADYGKALQELSQRLKSIAKRYLPGHTRGMLSFPLWSTRTL